MNTPRSALYALAQEEGADSEQLERYYSRLRLADLAGTRLPCPTCSFGTIMGGISKAPRTGNPCGAAGATMTSERALNETARLDGTEVVRLRKPLFLPGYRSRRLLGFYGVGFSACGSV